MERALALDANLAEAHAIKARILSDQGRTDEASAEIAWPCAWTRSPTRSTNRGALELPPARRRGCRRYFEKATALMETDFNSPLMLMTCYRRRGMQRHGARRAGCAGARGKDPDAGQNNGAAVASGADALAALGEKERASDWITRALLIDPTT
ncbi:MAG: hypothetical protein WDM81_04220 [Rhizomicrobium sp.]